MALGSLEITLGGSSGVYPRLLSTPSRPCGDPVIPSHIVTATVYSSLCQFLCFCTVDDVYTSIFNSLKDGN